MAEEYVLVSQGIEIYRTPDKKEAESIKDNSNKEYYNYLEKCANTGEIPVDNEVFMYEVSI